MSATNQPNLAATIRAFSGRLPRYAKLSASLMREGRIKASGRSPLTDVLGAGELDKLTRWVPLLRRLDRALASIGAIRAALNDMQSEKAEQHLEAAGLTREQIELDFQAISAITQRATSDGARSARELARDGVQRAGRAAGKGVRALQRWRKRWSSSSDGPASR